MLSQTFYISADASKDAHGALVYSRKTYKSGATTRRFVTAKTRVVPLAATSILRFGIDGSSIRTEDDGINFKNQKKKRRSASLNQITFWSDSVNVVWWIRDEVDHSNLSWEIMLERFRPERTRGSGDLSQ